SRVRRFKPGDEVYARPDQDRIGAFAEFISMSEDAVAIKPKTLTMEEAASILVAKDLGNRQFDSSEVAQAIADQIQVRLTPQEHNRLSRARPINPQAHVAYLEGTYFRNKWTEEALDKSIEFFSRAIDL